MRKCLALLLLCLPLAADQLVVRYDDESKTGSFCHAKGDAGPMECRTNNPRMEFPEATNPENLIDGGGTFCTLEKGRVDCGSQSILKQRQMPEFLTRATALTYLPGLLCGVYERRVFCYDDKKMIPVEIPESGEGEGVTAVRYALAAWDSREIRFWDRDRKLLGRVPVPAHEHLVVLDALQESGVAAATYCYSQGKTLTCAVGKKSASLQLNQTPERLFENTSHVCAVARDGAGLRLQCFGRYAIRAQLSFMPQSLGIGVYLKEVDGRGVCGIDFNDRMICWGGGITIEGFALKNAKFLPQVKDSYSCVTSPEGGGCIRDSNRKFKPRPAGVWVYEGLGLCEVDEKGIRTCTCLPNEWGLGCDGAFTFDASAFGEVLGIGGGSMVSVLGEKGLYATYNGHFTPKDFWPHDWKTPNPVALDGYHVLDGEFFSQHETPKSLVPWNPAVQWQFKQPTDPVTTFYKYREVTCLLDGNLFCFDKRTGALTYELAIGKISQLRVARNNPKRSICYAGPKEIVCEDLESDTLKRTFKYDKYYPVVATDGFYYFVRKLSGEIMRVDFAKGSYSDETLNF